MAVLEELTDDEKCLYALMMDDSGVDLAEFIWRDERPDSPTDGLFRCYDYQIPWYRAKDKLQIDQAGRSVGKSVGIQLRSFAFPFSNTGEEMLITAPELIHLDPVTKYVEDRLQSVRLTRDFLKKGKATSGITHRPFEAKFGNGSRIIGRIPNKDGRGIKGQHPKKLELDEAQDYPEPGWVELMETLKFSDEGATWRAHGVSRGVRDYFHKLTQEGSGWTVHRVTGMHRPSWSEVERKQKEQDYGGRHSPDYRRNILGQHGDASSPLFVLTRLMACVDSREDSDYNRHEYAHIRMSDERLRDYGGNVGAFLDFPAGHQAYARVWVGMDVGLTSHPTEILIFGEASTGKLGQPHAQGAKQRPADVLKLLTRLHLERISAPDQRAVLEGVYEFYRPQAIALDRTGLGLPLFQELLTSESGIARVVKGYNFSEKVIVGYEPQEEEFADEPIPIMGNILEWSSDQLRLLVDKHELVLPWDIDLIREFQGQSYTVKRSTTNPYGRKEFSAGSYHTLDAARMMAAAYRLATVELYAGPPPAEVILDSFVM